MRTRFRIGTILALFVGIHGCASPETVQIPPLPVGDKEVAYPDLLTRLRLHSTAATEAFYRDQWDGVAQSARLIQQSALYLPTSTGIPGTLQPTIQQSVKSLTQEAEILSQSANQKDERGVGESLSKIQFQIRKLSATK